MKQKIKSYLKKWMVLGFLAVVAYLLGFGLAQHERDKAELANVETAANPEPPKAEAKKPESSLDKPDNSPKRSSDSKGR